MKNKKRIYDLCLSAISASLYIVLTLISSVFGLSSGPVQLRLSEALCVLPFFSPATISGLAVGCLISNLITSGTLLDIVFGTLATLLGALGAYWLRKYKFLAPLPTVIANTVAVPLIIVYGFGATEKSLPILMLSIGIGEFLSAYVLGIVLLLALQRTKAFRGDL